MSKRSDPHTVPTPRTELMPRVLLVLVLLVVGSAASARDVAPPGDPVPVAYALRVLGDASRTRLILEFDGKPEHRVRLLTGPDRIAVELSPMVFALADPSQVGKGLVAAVRYGATDVAAGRLVLELARPASVRSARISALEKAGRHRLVLDLAPIDRHAFEALARQDLPPPPDTGPAAARRYTVMVDPGHGGVDGGATGKGGLREKDATLAFALAFRAAFVGHREIDVLLTREADTFLPLSRRAQMASEAKADLFVSVHADSLRQRSIRGATVYLLSREGSDAQSRRLARDQNRADLLGGIAQEAPAAAEDILVDLMRRETEAFSRRFAARLVATLRDEVRLIGNPIRGADFFVLRAPDVPSVLLELGYLSNREDERLLASAEWQRRAAGLLKAAVERFFAIRGAAAAAGAERVVPPRQQ